MGRSSLRGAALAAGMVLVASGMAVAAEETVFPATYAPTPIATARPADGVVWATARLGDRIVIGGSFTKMRTASGALIPVKGLASISETTGDVDPLWQPNPSGTVRALATDGTTLYVGGSFGSIGGETRTNLAALDASGWVLPTFAPPVTGGEVRDLALSGSTLYLGGSFTKVAGFARQRLAAVDAPSGALLAWAPAANRGVDALTVMPDGGVVAGGHFTSISGEARRFVALLSAEGAVSPAVFDLGSSCANGNPCYTWDLANDGTRVYSASGGPGGRSFAWDVDGTRHWEVVGDGDAQAVAVHGGTVFVGGHFHPAFGSSGGRQQMRSGLVAIDAATGDVSPYAPLVIGKLAVHTILADDTGLRIGGEFTQAGGIGQARFATFPATFPDPLPDPLPDAFNDALPDPLPAAFPDGQEPTPPSSISVTSVTSRAVTVRWGSSRDNTGVTAYRVVRTDPDNFNGTVKIYTVSAGKRSFTDTAVVGMDRYAYRVVAVDAAANSSLPTAKVIVETP